MSTAHAQDAHEATAAPHPHYTQYKVITGCLVLLTILELVLVKMPGIANGPMDFGLVLLAVTKAALVALFFMHLKGERPALKLTVAIPMCLPGIYALILIAEAGWRLLHGDAPSGVAP